MTVVTCDRCGNEIEIETRAPIGEGTQAARNKKSLNRNELEIGKILLESDKPLTVRQVQGILYDRKIKRQWGKEKVPSGHWNYQQVQTTLSMLLGTNPKIITMEKTKEYVDEDQYRYAKPTPYYFMSLEQKERFKEIQFKNGAIKFSLVTICPKCGHRVR